MSQLTMTFAGIFFTDLEILRVWQQVLTDVHRAFPETHETDLICYTNATALYVRKYEQAPRILVVPRKTYDERIIFPLKNAMRWSDVLFEIKMNFPSLNARQLYVAVENEDMAITRLLKLVKSN